MPAVVHLSCEGNEEIPREEETDMLGTRMPAQLGEGEWVVYTYTSEPGKLYHLGPYTAEEANAVAGLLLTAPYKAQGFRSVERVTV